MSTPMGHTRRVVTGHDGQGRPKIISDTCAEAKSIGSGAAFTLLWSTAQSPADNNDERDGADRDLGLTSAGGTVLRMVDFAPGSRSPMHRTASLDYGIVIKGEIDLELDGGDVTRLRVGDVVIQRGTNHAWVNGSDQPARMAFVLIDALPVRSGEEILEVTHR